MAQIKQPMILGVDKNTYVEPTIWTIEWTRNFYKYPVRYLVPACVTSKTA